MLKAQDILILLKLLAYPRERWNMLHLSNSLKMNYSTLHSAVKRLTDVQLVGKDPDTDHLSPNLTYSKDVLFHSLRFFFPAELGGPTRGVITGYAAPVFSGLFQQDLDLAPVWPYEKGNARGLTMEPLVKNAPELALEDDRLYEFLALVDVIRSGRSREVNRAKVMLENRLVGLA